VLIIGGAGPATRDGVVFGQTAHTNYRELAEHLVSRGYAVMRYDKRCAGESGCKPRSMFEDYSDDAQAALAQLRKRAEIDPARIVLFGHGEGGFVASVIAGQDQKLAAVVLASAPGRTLEKLFYEQARKGMAETGKSEKEISAYLGKLKRVVEILRSGQTAGIEGYVDPGDAMITWMTQQPELAMSLFINDPLQAVKVIRHPILVLQGEKDVQMSTNDAVFIEEELQRSHHPDFTVRVLPNVDYMLKTNSGAATMQSLNDASRPLDPAALAALEEWLQKKLK
jgi:pimeloyl-ACP methyl ester carboxylesterase